MYICQSKTISLLRRNTTNLNLEENFSCVPPRGLFCNTVKSAEPHNYFTITMSSCPGMPLEETEVPGNLLRWMRENVCRNKVLGSEETKHRACCDLRSISWCMDHGFAQQWTKFLSQQRSIVQSSWDLGISERADTRDLQVASAEIGSKFELA